MQISLASGLRILLVAAVGGLPAQADVIIVDDNGFEDFASIQDAIVAAADGDTILVRRWREVHDAEVLVIDGKGLTVLAHDPRRLPVGVVSVRNLDPGQTCVLSGFVFMPFPWVGPPALGGSAAVGLNVENCAGRVRVQDCSIRGWAPYELMGPGPDGVRIRSCVDVTLSNCDVWGHRATYRPNVGGNGIWARESGVRVYNCNVYGGMGAAKWHDYYGPPRPGPGGDGIRVLGGALGVVSSTVTGGEGGVSNHSWLPASGGNGGNGLSRLNGADVEAVSSTFVGGQAGIGIGGPGEDGVDVRGQITVVSTGLPQLSVTPRTAGGGEVVTVRVVGPPGDAVRLLLSRRTVSVPLSPERGAEHALAPKRLPIGTIPASGELEYSLTLPDVPSGASLVHLQAEVQQGGVSSRFSNPFSVTALDDEHLPECGVRVYVNHSAMPGGDGRSWATAYDDLYLALSLQPLCTGDPIEVWVAEGEYRPAPPGGDTFRTFRIPGGVHLYGGFGGTETQLAQRDPDAHPVVLSGDLNGDDLPGFVNRWDNSHHVVRTGSTENGAYPSFNVRIDGVTIRGGDDPNDDEGRGGGGVLSYCEGLTLARCIVEDNRAFGSHDGGGGVFHAGGGATIAECLVQGNVSGGDGGGLLVGSNSGPVEVSNCVVRGNLAGLDVGGVWIVAIDGLLSGTTVYANSAERYGGIRVSPDRSLQVANCIAWGNVDESSGDPMADNFKAPFNMWSNLRHSCIEGWNGFGGNTNTGLNPEFVDGVGPDGVPGTRDDDLRLQPFSPCIDAGRNSAVAQDTTDLDHDGDLSEWTPTDFDHLPRYVDDPAVPDTGDGNAPIIDMGAYERRGP